MKNEQIHQLTPISSKERIEMVDALRGFALTGVCLINLGWFSGHELMNSTNFEPCYLCSFDSIIEPLLHLLIRGKFWMIFSLLFGLGFSIILKRATSYKVNGTQVYIRRMLILLIFGLIHKIFIWSGDILLDYAFLGLILLLFQKAKGKWVFWLGIIIGCIVPAITAHIFFKLSPDAGKEFYINNNHLFSAFSSGTYSDVIKANIQNIKFHSSYIVVYLLPATFGIFLIGYWIGISGYHILNEQNKNIIKNTQKISGWTGLPLMLLFVSIPILIKMQIIPKDTFLNWIMNLSFLLFLLVALFYASTFMLFYQKNRWNKWLTVFKPLGRMALTNYLMQSVINVFLFYEIGLGLMGKVGYVILLLWFVLLISIQIIFSRWWLSFFRFGPFEWLWRSLTYGKIQKIKNM